MTGSVGSLTNAQMRSVLNSPSFASAAQPIAAVAGTMVAAEQAADGFSESAVMAAPDMAKPAVDLDSAPLDSAADARKMPARVKAEADALTTAIDTRPAGVVPIDGSTRPLSDYSGATGNAAAWRRISRDLPALLEEDQDARSGSIGWHSHRAPFLNSSDVIAVVVPVIGVAGDGRNPLLRFEGLKEGLAQLV